MKFLDQAKIYVVSGKGGRGCVSFRKEKYIEFGGPDGGNGGKGGDVIITVNTNLNTLIDFRYQQHLKEKNGEGGKRKNQTGSNGNDLIIKVPPGTQIYNEDKSVLLADLVNKNDQIIIAKLRKEEVLKECGIIKTNIKKSFKGKELYKTVCTHPFKDIGYDHKIKVLPADFVSLDQGTGIVHCAPAHGTDDYNLGIKHNIEIVQTVTDDGLYNENVPGFEGEHVYKVDLKIAEKLKEKLIDRSTKKHYF